MKRLVVFVFAAALLSTCIGCFDYHETMVINTDGSGTVTLLYGLEKDYIAEIEKIQAEVARQFGADAAEESGSPFDEWKEEEIRATLAEETEGIELTGYREFEKEGMQYWELSFSFADINQVYGLYGALYDEDEEMYGMEEEAVPEEELPPLFTEQDDGTWLFLRPLDDGMDESMDMQEYDGDMSEWGEDDAVDDEEPLDEEDSESVPPEYSETEESLDQFSKEMAEAFEGRTIKFVVTFPGEVIESNATAVEGTTATWEYPLTEMENVREIMAVIRK